MNCNRALFVVSRISAKLRFITHIFLFFDFIIILECALKFLIADSFLRRYNVETNACSYTSVIIYNHVNVTTVNNGFIFFRFLTFDRTVFCKSVCEYHDNNLLFPKHAIFFHSLCSSCRVIKNG